MESGKVVSLAGRRPEAQAKEFAVLFRVLDGGAQFKVFAGEMGDFEKVELAAAMEAAAKTLRGSLLLA